MLDFEERGTYNAIPGTPSDGYLPITPPVPIYRSYPKRVGSRHYGPRVVDVVDASGYGFPGAYDPMVWYTGEKNTNRTIGKRIVCGGRGAVL